jgi:hypothetical protein
MGLQCRQSYKRDLAGDEGINRSVRFPTQREMDEKLQNGEWQLHKFHRGIILTEIKQFPAERVLLVHVLAGEGFDCWIDEAWERLKSFGREHGCIAVEAQVRLGLVKKLKPLGFKQTRAELRAAI